VETETTEPTVIGGIRQRFPREVISLLLLGASLRVIFFILGQNNGGDALARATLTAGWLEHFTPRLNFEPWLPLHFWLMAAAGIMVRNPVIAARGLSVLLGIASLWIVWALTKAIYNRSAATLSLLIFSLYSLHIGYSTTSSSEVPYLFFVLLGLLGFFVNRRTGSIGALLLSGAALGVGAGIRYEAWVCIFAVFLALAFVPCETDTLRSKRQKLQEIILFSVVSATWPVFWLGYQWERFSKPLYGITMNYKWAPEQAAFMHRSILYRFALPPGVLLITLTPFILAAGVYGLWIGLRQIRGREFAVIVCVNLAVFIFQIAKGGLLPMARYTITLGTFAIIAGGYGIERFGALLSERNSRRLYPITGALMAINLAAILALSQLPSTLGDKIASVSPLLRFPRHIELVADYLHPQLKPEDSVIIDDYNVESNLVASAIGLPLLTEGRAFLASEQPISDLPEYVSREHPRYLIYANKGTLRTAVLLPQGCTGSPIKIADRVDGSCVFEDDVYRVYRISYGEGETTLAKR
jgi:4-amino-4-deoxy-L-arabinose transferase-like glycosyltransferase